MIVALGLVLSLTPFSAGEWRYVVPPEGTPLRRPPLMAVALSNEAPAELGLRVEFEGSRQRFGMLRYGDPDSTRIAVVLDELGPGRARLYVDGARDLTIDGEDLVGEVGRAWEVSLAVETRDGEGNVQPVPRRVAFELGPTGAVLGLATLGWLEGEFPLKGGPVRALRRDGDGNGFFHDPSDQLWLDLDGDGAWSPLTELFTVQPILSVASERYALRSDRLGVRPELERLEGTGHVTLVTPAADGEPRRDLSDVQALLVGRDGSAVLVRAPGPPTELPAGEYRLGMLVLTVTDPGGGAPWCFIFSEPGRRGRPRWWTVAAGVESALDPVGPLELSAEWPDPERGVRVGEGLRLVPRLHSGEGLLVNLAYRGRQAPTHMQGALMAEIALFDAQGTRRTLATSGFA